MTKITPGFQGEIQGKIAKGKRTCTILLPAMRREPLWFRLSPSGLSWKSFADKPLQ
jgi:hypothetical protein